MRRIVAVVVVFAALASSALPARADPRSDDSANAEPVHYVSPVDAVLVDNFRPPATPYGPGNRGIDYATEDGQPVAAAADGEVVFAGRVGLSLHVVVLHTDGIRSYGGISAAPDGTSLGMAIPVRSSKWNLVSSRESRRRRRPRSPLLRNRHAHSRCSGRYPADMTAWQYMTVMLTLQRPTTFVEGISEDLFTMTIGYHDGSAEVLYTDLPHAQRISLTDQLNVLGRDGWEAFFIDTVKGAWPGAQGFVGTAVAQTVGWQAWLKRQVR